jgi:hypothetical protein
MLRTSSGLPQKKTLPYSLIEYAATGNKKIIGAWVPYFAKLIKEINKVIAFASRQLLQHESNYTPMTAIVWAL